MRRFFSDEEMDLFVWYQADGEIIAFQLCHDKSTHEKAVGWRRDGGINHYQFDDEDEDRPHPRTPTLWLKARGGAYRELADRFTQQAGNIDSGVRDFVFETLTRASS